jgi:hypothetical protein
MGEKVAEKKFHAGSMVHVPLLKIMAVEFQYCL